MISKKSDFILWILPCGVFFVWMTRGGLNFPYIQMQEMKWNEMFFRSEFYAEGYEQEVIVWPELPPGS